MMTDKHTPEPWSHRQLEDGALEIYGSNGHLVLGDATEFVFNEDEYCKWELRKIYNAQKVFKNQHGKFTDKLEKLNYSNEYCLNATIEMKTSDLSLKLQYNNRVKIIPGS